MNSIIEQAYHILEQKTVLSFHLATQLYERCCILLGLVPTPLFTETEKAEEPP